MGSPETINIAYMLLIGTAGMLLLAGAAVFFFLTYYKRNISAKLELNELELHHQQTLIFSNLQTLEDERKRFAEDLHDEIGASLSAIRLHLGRMEKDAPGGTALRGQLAEAKEVVDHAMKSTRRISHNMLPPGLEMFGLSHVTEDMARTFSTAEMQVVFECSEDIPRLDYRHELAIYRVLQELLNNTVKHAGASEVKIGIDAGNGRYLVSYSDNGKGFNVDDMRYSGLGLRNIENRVRMTGGTFGFSSAPGKGLQVSIEMPLT